MRNALSQSQSRKVDQQLFEAALQDRGLVCLM